VKKHKRNPRKARSQAARIGLKLAKEVARIRGGLPSQHIHIYVLDLAVRHLCSGQFTDDENPGA
jgi:hypothetical protein